MNKITIGSILAIPATVGALWTPVAAGVEQVQAVLSASEEIRQVKGEVEHIKQSQAILSVEVKNQTETANRTEIKLDNLIRLMLEQR